MEKDLTLVILAGGMGSRFGGLKQIEPMGPNGEFIIDYSIYDALEAGFNKVVFLIEEENFDIFKETIGARVEPHIKVEYSFQKNDNVPIFYDELKDRQKPLGTAHAILCCKEQVHEPFMIINADDFYGRDAFIKGAEFLRNMVDEVPHRYGMVGYLVKNTITENGAVKRGVCNIENGNLISLDESKIEKTDNGLIATSLGTGLERSIPDNTLVSMNLLGFPKEFLEHIKEELVPFLEKNKEDLSTVEYLMPDVLSNQIKNNVINYKILSKL